ncbi:uncharacterized protein DS421_12g376800 [Arachis hypogaea]|nr:uncharacterized protein DS421_12g376800 [Arachis hypogaea]
MRVSRWWWKELAMRHRGVSPHWNRKNSDQGFGIQSLDLFHHGATLVLFGNKKF